MMAAKPADGWLPVLQDLERCHSAAEFAMAVYREVHQFLGRTGKATRRVKELLSALGGTEVGGLFRLPDQAKTPWKDVLTQSVEDLVHENQAHEKRLFFLWDEMPFMLASIRDREGERTAMEVLDLLRALRQTHGRLRMVVTGSIGFRSAIHLPQFPGEMAVGSHLGFALIHLREGRWSEAFQEINAGLECGAQLPLPHFGNAGEMVGAVFSAGLDPMNRAAKVNELLGIFKKHQALSALGEAVVQHLGRVFRTGAPFPSSDNLDGWVSAWEEAAKSCPDFGLTVRLLRTGVEFIKAGGARGVLLDLTSPERAILEQALGFTEG